MPTYDYHCAVNGRVVVGMPTGAEGIPAGQQLHACGAADGRHVEVAELQPRAGQPVDVGRLVLLAAVAAKPVLPHVVQEDEQDIRWPAGLFRGRDVSGGRQD